MNITPYIHADKKDWIRMTRALWPDSSVSDLEKELETILASSRMEILMANSQGQNTGFIFVSQRFEYVMGAETSPVGYIEGLFVEEKWRKKGVARLLVEAAEKWSKERGCKEMGSDTWAWNKSSQEFHKRLGFKEEDTIVHFIKKI